MTVKFKAFFEQATGYGPYPYQERVADTAVELPQLLDIPTGLGKTAAVVFAWLWRRRFADATIRQATPRRLVYCLPMRVLVEQTRDNALLWLRSLDLLGGQVVVDEQNGKKRLRSYQPDFSDPAKITVHILMGGEQKDDWDLYPEHDAILIGTQDMLLSRALNRGYGMSRYRWPMQFGLLHTDCLWVFDEIQLMGSGLATTAQLEAFRKKLTPNGCTSIWMSATLQRDWLKTVDFNPSPLRLEQLQADDLANKDVQQRREARKPLQTAGHRMDDPKRLADEIVTAHGKAGGRTLVVVNTVARACELFHHIEKRVKPGEKKPDLVLIHSRFRPQERAERIKLLLAEPGEHGRIVVSTQVVEAGVDVSATTLFTELAPWASLVQRFGRCNRRGTDNDKAQVFWIDLPADEKFHAKFSAPYETGELERARQRLPTIQNVAPVSLPAVTLPYQHGQVIRHKDFIELFDTTPDLAGNDIDVERYVREIDECDVQVFWREWPVKQPPPANMDGPRREELCAAPVGEFRDFAKAPQRRKLVYRWDYLDEQWLPVEPNRIFPGQVYPEAAITTFVEGDVEPNRIFPGQVYLLHATACGYEKEIGWDIKSSKRVDVLLAPEAASPPDANDADRLSQSNWQSIAQHSDRVCRELDVILVGLTVDEADLLKLAARWHDRGKAHRAFLAKLKPEVLTAAQASPLLNDAFPAKAPQDAWVKGRNPNANYRRHFRHELASALAVLMAGDGQITANTRNLVAYLVAAHHGKVRLSIRSLPEETIPDGNRRFARGIWEDDTLPATDLGNNVIAPDVTLSLEPMELGQSEDGQPSWAERMLRLRDTLGPFHLAYLEAILRAADARASRDNKPPEASHA